MQKGKWFLKKCNDKLLIQFRKDQNTMIYKNLDFRTSMLRMTVMKLTEIDIPKGTNRVVAMKSNSRPV
jgi:hypothetical protein